MTNFEKYVAAFVKTLGVTAEQVEDLKYLEIDAWDSVGHMSLIAELEDTFDIMMDTDDILDFESFDKGKEILEAKYDINFNS